PRLCRPGPSSRQLVRGPDLRRDLRHLRVGLVCLALPDEPRREQSVAFVSWHDVNVKVGDALADPCVGRDERAFGPKSLLNRDRRLPHGAEDGREEVVWQIVERVDVPYRHDEHVSRHERGAIEEGDHVLIAKDDLCGELALSDLAERACHSMVAACTDVTYGRYCTMRDQLSPSVLLAHTSPFAVPK